MKTILNPIEDRIILKQLDAPDMTEHGVILPDIAQEGAMIGEVVAVGPGRLTIDGKYIPPQCQIGERVMYLKFEAYKIEIEGEEFVVVREGSNCLTRLCEPEDLEVDKSAISEVLKETQSELNIKDSIFGKIVNNQTFGIPIETIIAEIDIEVDQLKTEFGTTINNEEFDKAVEKIKTRLTEFKPK